MKNKNTFRLSRPSFSFRFFLILIGAVFWSGFSRAQLITINGASTSGNIPMGGSAYHASEFIYLQQEINTAVNINRINFNCSALSTVSNTYNNVQIYMKLTPSSIFANGTYSLTGYTLVYNGSITWTALGWSGVSLTTPFNFPNTPGQNLQVLVIRNEGVTHTGNVFYCANGNSVAGAAALTSRRYNSTVAASAGVSTLTASAFRPAIQIGQVFPNDVSVNGVYTLGKIPIEYGSPTVIKANISNDGTIAQSNINVALTVAGTNTFTDNQVISSLAPGATAIVSFAPYTPSTLSSGDIITVTATASGDQNPANDSRNWSQDVTPNVYTYKNTAVGNNGGVGFNGATGDFVAKFNSHIGANPPYNVYSPQINEIKVDLTTSGQQYQLGIWDATGPSATPGVNLWTSPILTSAVGTAFVPVPNVSVNGDYYVGVRQIGTVNVGFAFQNESPIRPGTFFYTSPTGSTTWTDFATSSSPFRFAIEVTVHIPVPPACAINFSPADNSNLVCSNPILSWGSGGGAPTGYDVYFSTNATDVLNHAPAALVSTNQPGTTYSPAMSSFTTYYWSIIPQNADGPATGCGMQSFTTGSLPNCYCIPTHTGTLCDGAISQVDFNTLSNNATCAAPGYAVFNPTGSLTTTVQQGGTYTMNVTTISSDIISMWIDYNQNGIIDTTEWNQISTASTANTPASALITIPMTALTGNTLMRIRSRFTGNNNYGSDACTNFGSGSSQDYIITIIPPVPCSGTPNPGNTLASATAVCPGSSVNFFLQNQTSGTGVTYQWYNNAGLITGATNNTYTGVITIPDDFYCEVTCGGNTTPSNLISIGLSNFLTCYCIPTTTNGCLLGDHITNVSVATFANPINNASGTCLVNSYSDYTSLTAQASQGDQVAISVEVNNGGTEYAAGWIDFNHSGTFDAGEYIALTDADGLAPWIYNGIVTIPMTALPGITHMRFRSSFAATIAPNSSCAVYSYGETEDYSIDILPAVLCSGTPNPGNTIASTTSTCPSSMVNFSLQNPTPGVNISYQWYNNGGMISGATSPFYNQLITAADNIYCEVSCPLASPTTGSSVPVAVTLLPFLNCYCTPTNAGGSCITNVSLGTLNYSSLGCSGANNYNPINPLTTVPHLMVGNTYSFSMTTDAAAIASVWIDFNQNGLYEASEWQQVYTNASSGTISITVPPTALSGTTGMRVRSRLPANPNGAGDACIAMGSGETEDFAVIIDPATMTLNLTCFIQGYWDGVSAMVPALANQLQPSAPGECDTITVELHADTAPFGMDYTTQAILHQNGTATCIFPSITGNKYIVVKHRSALQTWSANPVAMAPVVSYNFSDANTKAYGDNQTLVASSPDVWALYSGDVIIDENMDLLDLGVVETDISNFGSGYLATDLNGDGNVDLLDSPMLELNISNFIYSNHP